MKKLSSIIFLIFSLNGFSQLIITEIADPNGSGSSNKRFIEVFNNSNSSIDLTDYKIKKWVGSSSSTSSNESTLQGTLEAFSFYIIAADAATFLSTYGFAANQITSAVVSGNGDDSYALIYSSGGATYDVFGSGDNTDGSNSNWEYEDGRAERASTSTTASNTFNSSNWNVFNDTGGGGSTNSPQTAPNDYDPGYWIGAPLIDTWNGLIDATWHTGSNWSSGTSPVSDDIIFIRDSGTNPIISTINIVATNLTVESSGSLTINAGKDLTLTGNFKNSGTVTLNSDSNEFSSLIIQGTSSGNIIYNRYVNSLSNGSGWDLIGSPVNGLQISSFASTNDSPLATGNGSGAGASGEYAIGVFNSSSNSWSNYTTANVSTTQFTPGKGYQMATDSGATLAFTGTVDTDATETIAIQNYAAASGSRWNLISNPYPSFLIIGPSTTTDTFLEVNDDVIDATYAGVYGYDGNSGDGSNYTIYNNTSTGKIAPGQGFFVAARSSSSANITFKEAMQTTSTGDDFFEGDAFQFNEVELRLSNEENYVGKTNIFFIEGLSNGLDIGWDAGSFSQNASIMSRMIEEDEGHGMAINAMGLDAMESTVIPLVINQPAGQEFKVSLFTATIPDTNVYLEDNVLGTFTNLYEQDYIHTSDVDLSEVGRFFIHMTEDTMSNNEYSTNLLNVFKRLDADYITVEGLASQSNETKVSLYDILGKNIINQTLDNNTNTQTISTSGLQPGIYIVQLKSDKTVSKKISIQ